MPAVGAQQAPALLRLRGASCEVGCEPWGMLPAALLLLKPLAPVFLAWLPAEYFEENNKVYLLMEMLEGRLPCLMGCRYLMLM